MKEFTKKILFQLNLFAALAILLAYASNYITPTALWPIAFFGLAYPYLLAINLFFLIFWTWRVNKYALLSLIVILVGVGNIGRYVQSPSSNSTEDQKAIKVLTYNIRVFDNYNWCGEDIDRDSIISFINYNEPDIVCLQEFFIDSKVYSKSETHTRNLLKPTPNHHILYSQATAGNSRRFGIATFSKYPIVRKGSINFENSHNICIYSDIVFNADTVRIYNLHLQSISLKKDYTLMDSLAYINSKRIDEVKDISKRLKAAFIRRAQQVDAVKAHVELSPYPVILCGDFNDTPVSYTYHKLLGNKTDAFREAGSGLSQTYRGNLPSYRIDYIFHDAFFNATEYSVPKVRLSDHYPVISVLSKN